MEFQRLAALLLQCGTKVHEGLVRHISLCNFFIGVHSSAPFPASAAIAVSVLPRTAIVLPSPISVTT